MVNYTEPPYNMSLKEFDIMCPDITNDLVGNYSRYFYITLFMILVVLSIGGLIFVVYSILYNPKLQQHPSNLVAAICVIEAMLTWQTLISAPHLKSAAFLCEFTMLPKALATVFRIDDMDAFTILNRT